jgi:2-hydroxycyclohexanecarboxyl-CoA dehydrogenase
LRGSPRQTFKQEKAMNLNIAGKTVVITGGGSNIGRSISLAFAAEGAKIVIADIDQSQGEKVAKEALAAGAQGAIAHQTDITSITSVTDMVARAKEEFGPVDILVNNVGWTIEGLFIEQNRSQWEKEIQINLWGMINCTRSVLDDMIARKSGVIVSMGSDAARMGEFREGVYAACKAGVVALTKTLAREYGKHGIRLNVVCPGTTMPDSDEEISDLSMWAQGQKRWNTPEMRERIAKIYPLRRIARPGEVAPVVVFLASDGASFITGQTISASGGYTMM